MPLSVRLFVFVILGLVMTLVFSMKDSDDSNWQNLVNPETIYTYQNEIDNLEQRNQELYQRIGEYQERLKNYETDDTDGEAIANELYNEIQKYDIIIGSKDLSGPGVEIELSDSTKELQPGDNINNYIIHNSDVLSIINTLKAYGAEAIALNGYKLSWDSQIDCAGPVIYIDDFIAGAPFVIEAIGDQDTLYAGLESEDSIVQLLRYWDINIDIQKKNEIVIESR